MASSDMSFITSLHSSAHSSTIPQLENFKEQEETLVQSSSPSPNRSAPHTTQLPSCQRRGTLRLALRHFFERLFCRSVAVAPPQITHQASPAENQAASLSYDLLRGRFHIYPFLKNLSQSHGRPGTDARRTHDQNLIQSYKNNFQNLNDVQVYRAYHRLHTQGVADIKEALRARGETNNASAAEARCLVQTITALQEATKQQMLDRGYSVSPSLKSARPERMRILMTSLPERSSQAEKEFSSDSKHQIEAALRRACANDQSPQASIGAHKLSITENLVADVQRTNIEFTGGVPEDQNNNLLMAEFGFPVRNRFAHGRVSAQARYSQAGYEKDLSQYLLAYCSGNQQQSLITSSLLSQRAIQESAEKLTLVQTDADSEGLHFPPSAKITESAFVAAAGDINFTVARQKDKSIVIEVSNEAQITSIAGFGREPLELPEDSASRNINLKIEVTPAGTINLLNGSYSYDVFF